jgi:TetR/AcrR family transcriptional repressor of mexJK operon
MNAADTKTRILEAATTLFLDQGYGSTSLDQIAAAAGVTKPTVYSHFGSKQGLLEAMTTRYTDIRVDEFRDNLLSGGPPR